MPTPFSKMHGLGNDFVVINNLQPAFIPTPKTVRELADRHTGIGFDQLLIISPSDDADFFCQIYNSDGSEAEQCGNGLRCVARFVHENKLHTKSQLTIATVAGVFPITIHDYDHIAVTLGTPTIENLSYPVAVNAIEYPLTLIQTGNPHAILKVAELNDPELSTLGHAISTHKQFPQGVNVGFLQLMTDDRAKLRTVERGAGETLACGSNATAAGVAGIRQGWFKKNRVQMDVTLGSLIIEWEGEGKPVTMTGPAVLVYTGELSSRKVP